MKPLALWIGVKNVFKSVQFSIITYNLRTKTNYFYSDSASGPITQILSWRREISQRLLINDKTSKHDDVLRISCREGLGK